MKKNKTTKEMSLLQASVGNLIIVGTAHVGELSIQEVKRVILENKPSVVAVELCRDRLIALMSKAGALLPFGSNILVWSLALLERIVGAMVGTQPGSEMLAAVDGAKQVGAKVEFIDMPIREIMLRIRSIPRKEKARLMLDCTAAIFAVLLTWKMSDNTPRDLEILMARFSHRYPMLYEHLMRERNRYMSGKLHDLLASTFGKVVAVVGLGHVEGLIRELYAEPLPKSCYG